MRKSSWLLLLLAVAAILILICVYGSRPKPSATAASSTTPSHTASSPGIPPDSLTLNRRLGTTAAASEADERGAGESDPELIGVSEALRAYRAGIGENPIGTNAEITKALTGTNARKANFGDDLKIKDGQIIDRWGHPYFFHQLSSSEMEIRSAGPDGVMWTKDDEVMR